MLSARRQAVLTIHDCASTASLLWENTMAVLLLHWLISSASLLVVAYLFPGIEVRGLGAALIAPIVIGLVNATLGLILKLLTLPLTLLTLGLFWLIINALMLQLASFLVPGFFVAGFWSAFFGAIVLSIVSMILRALIPGV
jgi:putative membrane protein